MCGTGPFAAEPPLADTARAATTTAATRSFTGLARRTANLGLVQTQPAVLVRILIIEPPPPRLPPLFDGRGTSTRTLS